MNLIDLEFTATASSLGDDNKMMVLLKEKNGDRTLPITVSTKRGMSLMMRKVVDIDMPLPLSVADIMKQMFDKMGLRLDRVQLMALSKGMFICKIVAVKDGEEFEVDYCQAPDGLILANTFHCRLCIDEELLEAQYMRKVGENAYALNLNTLSVHMLEDALKHAIEEENYEVASKLRDELQRRKE